MRLLVLVPLMSCSGSVSPYTQGKTIAPPPMGHHEVALTGRTI